MIDIRSMGISLRVDNCRASNNTFGEIKCKSWLISTQIVDVKNELIWKVFLVSPDDPSYSSVDKAIFMSTDIDALHQWQAEVPFQIWVQEGGYESSTCSINMDGGVPPAEINLQCHNSSCNFYKSVIFHQMH